MLGVILLSRNIFASGNTHDLSSANSRRKHGHEGRAAVVARAGIRLAGKWSRFTLAELLASLVGFKTSLATL